MAVQDIVGGAVVDPRAWRFVEWASALHAHDSRFKLVAMFKVYLDESADAKKERIFVIAGWLGSVETWEQFIPKWHDRISREGLRSFHMTDCEARRQEFKGWSVERKNDLVVDLINIINATEITGFASGVVMPDFKRIVANHPTMRRFAYSSDPYFLIFTKCAHDICGSISGLPASEEVAFVFDEQETIADKMVEYFRRIKHGTVMKCRRRLRSITFASRENEMPLQAADMLAYEVRKFKENSWVCPDRPERKSFASIKHKIVADAAHLFGDEFLSELAKMFSARFSPNGRLLGPRNSHQSPT